MLNSDDLAALPPAHLHSPHSGIRKRSRRIAGLATEQKLQSWSPRAFRQLSLLHTLIDLLSALSTAEASCHRCIDAILSWTRRTDALGESPLITTLPTLQLRATSLNASLNALHAKYGPEQQKGEQTAHKMLPVEFDAWSKEMDVYREGIQEHGEAFSKLGRDLAECTTAARVWRRKSLDLREEQFGLSEGCDNAMGTREKLRNRLDVTVLDMVLAWDEVRREVGEKNRLAVVAG